MWEKIIVSSVTFIVQVSTLIEEIIVVRGIWFCNQHKRTLGTLGNILKWVSKIDAPTKKANVFGRKSQQIYCQKQLQLRDLVENCKEMGIQAHVKEFVDFVVNAHADLYDKKEHEKS